MIKVIIVLIILWILLRQNNTKTIEGYKPPKLYGYIPHDKMDMLYEYLPLEFYYMDKEYLDNLTKLSTTVLKILDRHNIKFWAVYGTCLGAIRHNGLIPWDDDFDIAFDIADENKLLAIQKDLESEGMVLTLKSCDYRMVYKIKYVKNPSDKHKNVWLDLFPYYYKKDDDSWHRVKGKYVKIKNQDLFPLKKVKFNDYKISVPNNYMKYLNDFFGNDWNDVAVVSIFQKIYGNHIYIKLFKQKVPLDDKHRNLKLIKKD
jgi:hypothetical protein